MDVFITEIRLHNFKIFKNATIRCNKDVNIFIGDNATGKSSILRAIDLVLSGSATKVLSFGLESIMNAEIVSEWKKNPNVSALPETRVEIVFAMPDQPKWARFNGEKYSGGKSRAAYGIKMVCSANPDYMEDIKKSIGDGACQVFPFEFYTVEFSTFADTAYSGFIKPCKTLAIDNSAINTAKALRYVVERTYKNAVEDNERVSKQHEFRTHVDQFELPVAAVKKNLVLTGDLESCLDIQESGVCLADQGEGRISMCKTECALEKKVEDISILTIEEPENHLSHHNLRHLITNIQNRVEDRQIFMASHSSYVTARLGLQKAFFVNRTVKSLSCVSEETADFFMKAPNDNLLQFVLSSKVLLVEGAAEYILADWFIRLVTQQTSEELGIWTIALNNLSFKRYLEVAKTLGINVSALRDNDGSTQKRYGEFEDEKIRVFSDASPERRTFEICLFRDNEEVLNHLFQEQEDVLHYMLKNKAEAAYRILKSKPNLVIPEYIKSAIEWLQ